MLSGRRADTQKICSSSLYVGRIQYDMSVSIGASIMIVRFEWIFCCKNSVFSCLKNEKKHSFYKDAIRISLRVFWNIRIWTCKMDTQKNGSTCTPKMASQKVLAEGRGYNKAM